MFCYLKLALHNVIKSQYIKMLDTLQTERERAARGVIWVQCCAARVADN